MKLKLISEGLPPCGCCGFPRLKRIARRKPKSFKFLWKTIKTHWEEWYDVIPEKISSQALENNYFEFGARCELCGAKYRIIDEKDD